MTSTPGSSEFRGRDLELQIDALSRRFAALASEVMTSDPTPHPLLPSIMQDLATALEELEVAVEELQAQDEALVAAHEHLDAEATRYRELFDLAPDGYLLTDAYGVILEANHAASALFGIAAESLVGKPVILFIDDADRRFVLNQLRDATTQTAGAAVELEVRCAPPDAPDFPASIRLSSSVVPPGDAEKRVRWLVRDVTQREANAALESALEHERAEADALRDLDAAKNSILLAVSHDLRAPIATASALADVLLDRLPTLSQERLRDIGAGIASSTHKLASILTNLLDAERLAGGHVIVHPQRVDLTSLTASCAHELGLTETAAGLPDEPIYAEVDPGLTTRILSNLLGNANQHASGGRPPLVSIAVDDGAVTISVDDDGPGVPDELKESIFDAFERGPGTSAAGLGLGLHLVRRFAELQGGRAWVEDSPEGGASFRVRLPTTPHDADG